MRRTAIQGLILALCAAPVGAATFGPGSGAFTGIDNTTYSFVDNEFTYALDINGSNLTQTWFNQTASHIFQGIWWNIGINLEFDANIDDKVTVKIDAHHRQGPNDGAAHGGAGHFSRTLQIEGDTTTTTGVVTKPAKAPIRHPPHIDRHSATLSGILDFGVITDDPLIFDDFASFTFHSDATHSPKPVPAPPALAALLTGLGALVWTRRGKRVPRAI